MVRSVELARSGRDSEQELDRRPPAATASGASPSPTMPIWIWSDSQNGSLNDLQSRHARSVVGAARTCRPVRNRGSCRRANTASTGNRRSRSRRGAPGRQVIGWFGGNVVFQTTDRGRIWTVISPDLTRNIKSHQSPAGRPNRQRRFRRRVQRHDSRYRRIARVRAARFGSVPTTVSCNSRATAASIGRNVTPPGAPQFGRFATVAPSTLVDGTAYAIERRALHGRQRAVRVRHARLRPALDAKSSTDCPPMQWVRSIRPDIRNRNLVYLGTEEGIWISFDGGANWQSFQNDLPPVSVRDIRMQPQYDDLVIATHGRSCLHHGRRAPGARAAAGRRARHLAVHAAHRLRMDAAPQRRGHVHQLCGGQSAVRRDDHVLSERAAENAPGARHSRRPRARDPQRFGNAQSRRQRRAVRFKQGGIESVHVGLQRQRSGEVERRGARLSQRTRHGPGRRAGTVLGAHDARPGTRTSALHRRSPIRARSFTQAEYERSFNEGDAPDAAYFRKLDTMLNNLDDVKKSIDAALASAKKTNNAALTAKLQDASNARASALRNACDQRPRRRNRGRNASCTKTCSGAFFERARAHHAGGRGLPRARRRRLPRGHRSLQRVRERQLPGVNAALEQAGMNAAHRSVKTGVAMMLVSSVRSCWRQRPTRICRGVRSGPPFPAAASPPLPGTPQDDQLYYLGTAGGGVWKSRQRRRDVGAGVRKAAGCAQSARSQSIRPTSTSFGPARARRIRVTTSATATASTSRPMAAKTWTRVGLAGVWSISRIAIDPRDPRHVVVGAFGDPYQRFGRSRRLRYVRRRPNVAEVALLSPSQRRQRRRDRSQESQRRLRRHVAFPPRAVDVHSGGADGGLYKSTDGGRTWKKLTGQRASQRLYRDESAWRLRRAMPDRVFALIEAKAEFSGVPTTRARHWTMVRATRWSISGRFTLRTSRSIRAMPITSMPSRKCSPRAKTADGSLPRSPKAFTSTTMRFGSIRRIPSASSSVRTAATRLRRIASIGRSRAI